MLHIKNCAVLYIFHVHPYNNPMLSTYYKQEKGSYINNLPKITEYVIYKWRR